jgi:hypothetical protein
MKMSLGDMDALKGIPTVFSRTHNLTNQVGPGFSPDSFSLYMGNLESHLPGEQGLKLMPIARI